MWGLLLGIVGAVNLVVLLLVIGGDVSWDRRKRARLILAAPIFGWCLAIYGAWKVACAIYHAAGDIVERAELNVFVRVATREREQEQGQLSVPKVTGGELSTTASTLPTPGGKR